MPSRYITGAGGKKLRAGLVCLSSALVSGRYEKAIPSAAAVELLHNFSLVHDDIMDNDDLRRGLPTIHKKWNPDIAILTGDFLCAMAYKALENSSDKISVRLHRVFTNGYIALCEGQALDKEFEAKENVTIKQYLRMIELKTASLFGTAMQLGAIAGSASLSQEKALFNFGRDCGMAFQIQDDLLDIVSDETTLGKDIGSDLKAGKKTYVFLLAREYTRGQEILSAFSNAAGEDTHQRLLTDFKVFIREEGIQQKTHTLVEKYIISALKQLKSFKSNQAKDELIGMIERIRNRKN